MPHGRRETTVGPSGGDGKKRMVTRSRFFRKETNKQKIMRELIERRDYVEMDEMRRSSKNS